MPFQRRFSHCKSIGAKDPQGGTIFDPRLMIGRIYDGITKHCYMYMLNTLALVVLEKKIFSHYKPMADIEANLDSRAMAGRIYEGDYQTLLHTKY